MGFRAPVGLARAHSQESQQATSWFVQEERGSRHVWPFHHSDSSNSGRGPGSCPGATHHPEHEAEEGQGHGPARRQTLGSGFRTGRGQSGSTARQHNPSTRTARTPTVRPSGPPGAREDRLAIPGSRVPQGNPTGSRKIRVGRWIQPPPESDPFAAFAPAPSVGAVTEPARPKETTESPLEWDTGPVAAAEPAREPGPASEAPPVSEPEPASEPTPEAPPVSEPEPAEPDPPAPTATPTSPVAGQAPPTVGAPLADPVAYLITSLLEDKGTSPKPNCADWSSIALDA